MENASKALIIAGAILISILLISVGIIIMNAINDPVSKGADVAKDQAVQIFNTQFTSYIGSGVDYNTAKQCITAVASTAREGGHKIEMLASSTDYAGKTGITMAGKLKSGKTYTIEFYDVTTAAPTADGYFSGCFIFEEP